GLMSPIGLIGLMGYSHETKQPPPGSSPGGVGVGSRLQRPYLLFRKDLREIGYNPIYVFIGHLAFFEGVVALAFVLAVKDDGDVSVLGDLVRLGTGLIAQGS